MRSCISAWQTASENNIYSFDETFVTTNMSTSFTTHVRRFLDEGHRFRKSILPSGLRILSEYVPGVHSLAIGVWINAGSRDEARGREGIAHFVEHTVFKGTTRRRSHHIAQYLETVGGYINAYTTKDSTCYYARVLTPHLSRATHLLADIVLCASLPEKEIEKEKNVVIEEMRGAEDDPEDMVHDRFEALLYGRHPLGQPVIGNEKAVRSFTRNALSDFVAKKYVSENMLVAAAGAVDHEALLELCEREFSIVPHGVPVRRRRPSVCRGSELVAERSVQQSHLVMGVDTVGSRDERRMLLQTFSALLGEGMSSRLFQRIRERHGYAYNIYSFVNSYQDVSTLGVYAAVEQGRERRARELVLREIQELATSRVSMREFNRAREQVVGGLVLGLESMSARMTRLGRDELGCGRDVPVSELLTGLQELSTEDIRLEAERMLADDGPSCCMILPAASGRRV